MLAYYLMIKELIFNHYNISLDKTYKIDKYLQYISIVLNIIIFVSILYLYTSLFFFLILSSSLTLFLFDNIQLSNILITSCFIVFIAPTFIIICLMVFIIKQQE